MYDEIQKQLRIRNIDCKIMGLGTEGASAMAGKKKRRPYLTVLKGQFPSSEYTLCGTSPCIMH